SVNLGDVAAVFWNCACELIPRLRDCASAKGIAQAASSESRINALQSSCALMEESPCFFMVLAFVVGENHRSNPLRVQTDAHDEEEQHRCARNGRCASRLFIEKW